MIALTKAKALLLSELGIDRLPEGGELRITHLDLPDFTIHRALYLFSDGRKRIISKGFLELTEAECAEFFYEEFFRKLDDHQEKRDQIAHRLMETGRYQRNTVGLRSAIRIYEILADSYKPLTAVEIMQRADNMEALVDSARPMTHFKEQIISELPALRGSNGRITITARRALSALYKAGMIQKYGSNNQMTYRALSL